jgi:hypothetical protein
MKKALFPAVALLALLAASARPAAAVDEVNDCPADWMLAATPEPHPADVNGDRAVCSLRTAVDGRTVQLWTDNAVGNPHIHPPDPCTGDYLPLVLGDRGAVGDPHLLALDANGDGTLCAAGETRGLILILNVLDNARAER